MRPQAKFFSASVPLFPVGWLFKERKSRVWDVVIATEDRFESPSEDPFSRMTLEEEHLLMAALEKRGLKVRRVSWSNPTFDWNTAASTVLRSTWDYFVRKDEFLAWIEAVRTRTRLLNAASLVTWNSDKRYLRDLEGRGIRIPPTRFLDPLAPPDDLATLMRQSGWECAVLKPAVSAGAFETFLLSRATPATDWEAASHLVRLKPTLLQEYLPSIEVQGELSIVFLGGRYSHAVRKRSACGDFRVQVQHGGQYAEAIPSAADRELASQVIATCAPAPVYARVDFVQDEEGNSCLMELELIEPDLYCRLVPGSADRLADAIIEG